MRGGVGGVRGGRLRGEGERKERGERKRKRKRKEKKNGKRKNKKKRRGEKEKKEREVERFAPRSRRPVGHACAVGRDTRAEGEQRDGFRCRGRVFRRSGDQAGK